MKGRVLVILAALMVLLAPAGKGLTEYVGPDNIMSCPRDWPKELIELVRTDTRVLGIVGPIIDIRIHCAGDTADLNAFLKGYAKVPGARLRVVLHPGGRTAGYERYERDPAKEEMVLEEHVVDVDWSLHIREYVEPLIKDRSAFEDKKLLTTLDVWLGGQTELDKLDVPPSIDVLSGGEIERFIRRHEEKQEQRDKNQ